MTSSSSKEMKEVKTKEDEIIWGFYLDNKFHEAHWEIMKWITLDPTLEMVKHDPRLAQGWKNLRPYWRLPNGGDPCPLEKKVEETLIPPQIVHMDDIPNWRVLGINLNLSRPNEEPLLLLNLDPFHVLTRKAWQKAMQL